MEQRHWTFFAIIFATLLLFSVYWKERHKFRKIDPFSPTKLDDFLANNGELRFYDELSSNFDENLLSCKDYRDLVSESQYLASGWTKSVYSANYGDEKELAVKIVNLNGQQIKNCLENSVENDLWICYSHAARKLIKEIALLRRLKHPNLVQLLGYCIPLDIDRLPQDNDPYRLAIMTSLGSKVNIIKLLQYDWEDRLMMISQVADLLQYLKSSPLGTIKVSDFRREQFVLTQEDNSIKLADIDDFTLDVEKCDTHNSPKFKNQNQFYGGEENNVVFVKEFVTLLREGAPSNNLEIAVENLTSSSPNEVLERIHELKHEFLRHNETGIITSSLDSNMTEDYSEHMGMSLDLDSDYECFGSKVYKMCIVSVANLQEARQICDSASVCQAFVLTNMTSSSGRTIIQLKNRSNPRIIDGSRTTFVKRRI